MKSNDQIATKKTLVTACLWAVYLFVLGYRWTAHRGSSVQPDVKYTT